MKKNIKLLSVLGIIILTTGCMKFDTTMTINKNGSMDLSITEALNDSIIESMQENEDSEESSIFDEDRLKEIQDQGYKVKEYSEDSMTGYTFTKSFPDINSISTTKSVETDLGLFNTDEDENNKDNKYFFQVKKSFFKNTYVAKYISSDTDMANEQLEEAEETEGTDEDSKTDDNKKANDTNADDASDDTNNANANTSNVDNANANTTANTDSTNTNNNVSTDTNNATNQNAEGTQETEDVKYNTTVSADGTIVGPAKITTAEGEELEIADGVTYTLKDGDEVVNPDETSDDSAEIDTMLSSVASTMDLKFVVNLPNKALSSNATSTDNDGKKLVWNLQKLNGKPIQFEFEIYNMTNVYIAIGGGAALLLIIILIIVTIIKKGKKPKVVDRSSSDPVPDFTTSTASVLGDSSVSSTDYHEVVTPVDPTPEPVIPSSGAAHPAPDPVIPVGSIGPAPSIGTPDNTNQNGISEITPTPAPTGAPVQPMPMPNALEPESPIIEPVPMPANAEPVTPAPMNNAGTIEPAPAPINSIPATPAPTPTPSNGMSIPGAVSVTPDPFAPAPDKAPEVSEPVNTSEPTQGIGIGTTMDDVEKTKALFNSSPGEN